MSAPTSAGLLAFTESAQKNNAAKPNKKKSKAGPSAAIRYAGAGRHKEQHSEEEEPDSDPPKDEPDSNQKRLIVSGLTQSFTAEELKQRFSAFGRVVALDEWPGPRNALGELRPFAYLTIEATGPQVSRCINLLNNSMWKGTMLRVGEAKPDFRKRRLAELEKARKEEGEAATKPAKRKRLPGHIGVEAADMQPVTPQRVKEGLWGWKRTPAGHLIRPLHIRPDRPLPKPQPLKTKDGENVKGTRRPRANAVPPKRAKRVTIDPTRYGAVHITGSMLDGVSEGVSVDLSALGPGEWQCEEIDEEDEAIDTAVARPSATTRLVRWRYIGKDGDTLHEEFARLPIQPVIPPATAQEGAASSVAPTSTGVSTLAVPAQHRSVPEADALTEADLADGGGAENLSDDELDFGNAAHSDASSDLFAGFPTSLSATNATDAVDHTDDAEDVDVDAAFDAASEAGSDLFSGFPSSISAAAAAAPLATTEDRVKTAEAPAVRCFEFEIPKTPYDPDAESDFSEGYQEGPMVSAGDALFKAAVLDTAGERDKTLGLLSSFLGADLAEAKQGEVAPAPIYTPFAEEDDEIDEIISKPTAIVAKAAEASGAAGAEEDSDEPSDSSSSSVSSSSSDSTSALESEAESEAGSNAKRSVSPPSASGSEAGAETAAAEVNADDKPEAETEAQADGEGTQQMPAGAAAGGEEGADALALGDAQTRMQSLTEMFRPQEEGSAGKGFSLMGVLGDNLELELDEELDFAMDEDEEAEEGDANAERQGEVGDAAGAAGGTAASAVAARGPHSWFDSEAKLPFLFPGSRPGVRDILERLKDASAEPLVAPSGGVARMGGGALGAGWAGMTGANAVEVSRGVEGGVGYVAFCRSETESEMEAKWASRRVELTKEFKKMHREAVRKKKRKFVGSKRAAAAAAGGGAGAVGGRMAAAG
ncbi:hypothetical protein ACQY0O_004793 [Thecaphora frezii]